MFGGDDGDTFDVDSGRLVHDRAEHNAVVSGGQTSIKVQTLWSLLPTLR